MISEAPRRVGAPDSTVLGPGGRLPVATSLADPAVRTYEIGRSEEGRPIEIARRGPEMGELRILVLAGQHGDEPWGRSAVRRWIAESDHRRAGTFASPSTTCLAVLDVNPDGSQRNRRKNVHEVDLNRDHLLLEATETRAVHAAVRRYSPHLIVDVHNFPSRRRHLLARGWTIGADIQLAGATHPAIRTSMTAADEDELMLRVSTDLGARGYTAVPYTLFRRSGRARPSTLRVRDARNSLSLRYGTPTVLLEGRDPGRRDSIREGPRTVEAELEALRSIESWASEHREALLRGPPIPEAGESVAIDARWTEDGEPRSVPLARAGSGEVVRVRWARFAGGLHVRSRVSLPRAYAVRNDLSGIHAVLLRHGVSGDRIEAPRSALVETVRTGRAASERTEDAPASLAPTEPFASDLEGYTAYSVHQRAGRALAVWLEGGPRIGLARLRSRGEPERARAAPAVLRVVRWDYPEVGAVSSLTVPAALPGRPSLGPSRPPFRWAFGPCTPLARDREGSEGPIPCDPSWDDRALPPSAGPPLRLTRPGIVPGH